jgi:hypothetical protein
MNNALQKVLDTFKSSLSNFWLAYLALIVQWIAWQVIIFNEKTLTQGDRRLLLAVILCSQLVFIGMLSLRSWWESRDVAKVQAWWKDARVNIAGLIGSALLTTIVVYFATLGRSSMELEPFTVLTSLVVFYVATTLLLYRGSTSQLWNYCYEFLTNHAVGYFFGLLFWIGVQLIFFALDSLFKVNIPETWTAAAASFALVLVANAVILTRFVTYNKAAGEYNLPKAWQIFLKFVAFPLMSIYTLILLFYFATLLVSGQLPENQLINTILALYIPGFIVVYLGWPLPEGNKYFNLFYKIWLSAALLISLMYFYAIYLRINQHGFTIERLVVVTMGVIALTGFGILVTNYQHRLLVSLVIFAAIPTIFVFTPMLNMFDVSRAAQTARLMDELVSVGRVKNGVVQKDVQIDTYDKYSNVKSKLSYLLDNHGVALLDERVDLDLRGDFKLTNEGFVSKGVGDNRYDKDYNTGENLAAALLGIQPGFTPDERGYYYVNLLESAKVFDLTRYSQMRLVSTQQDGLTADGLKVINSDQSAPVTFDLTPLYDKLKLEQSNISKPGIEYDQSQLTFSAEASGLKYELVVEQANFQTVGDKVEVANVKGYLFLLK